ncbi:MAG TPA: DUF3341 domain-containing protein, partial [Armatimonadetes bacterium]|nr:DUF3341 domain-containing protein [Armatimonadota bacterium]
MLPSGRRPFLSVWYLDKVNFNTAGLKFVWGKPPRPVFKLGATFTREDDLLRAVSGYRESGFEIVDAYTPYAVHGLD